jgi:MoaA/NifB/PqqE/SkfB family radical SAM enzyme
MACRHCGDDVWGNPDDDMSFEEIETFCNNLGHVDDVSLGGGEPFLRKDLADICALFYEKNGTRSINIPSNGFATDTISVKVEEILAKCPGATLNMMLSLDGFQQTHDNMRMPGSFTRVIETGHRLTELKKLHPRMTLCFNATITGDNWQELPALATFIRDTFQTNLEFNILTGNPRDTSCKVPSRSELEQTIDAIYAVHNVASLTMSHHQIYRDVVLKTNIEKRQIVPCRAGSLVCMIDANGDVRACPLLSSLGNLRVDSFQSIWHSESAKLQYRSICKGECTCNNDCFIRISLMNNWKLPLYMLKKRFKSL